MHSAGPGLLQWRSCEDHISAPSNLYRPISNLIHGYGIGMMILKVFPIHAHAMPRKIHTLRHSQHCVWYVFDSWTHRKYTGYTQEHHCYTIAMARVTLARPWLCTKLVPASLATTSMRGLSLERNDVNGGWISTSKSYNNHILITHFGKSCYMLTSANICYIWYIANICKPSSNPKEPNLYQPMRYKIGTNMVQMMYKLYQIINNIW